MIELKSRAWFAIRAVAIYYETYKVLGLRHSNSVGLYARSLYFASFSRRGNPGDIITGIAGLVRLFAYHFGPAGLLEDLVGNLEGSLREGLLRNTNTLSGGEQY